MTSSKDISILRGLAQQIAEIANSDEMIQRRELWRAHNSLEPTRPMVLVGYGMHNVWCREVFSEATLQCEERFCRDYERLLRMAIFHTEIGDDFILEPWIVQSAARRVPGGGLHGGLWGVGEQRETSGIEGGAWKGNPPIENWEDIGTLIAPEHIVNEEATLQHTQRLQDIFGNILEIDVNRGPVLIGFAGDISTTISSLRGLEQLMIDMYESPDELKALLAFMRDGILANQQQAEAAGDFSLAAHQNQAMCYSRELEDPAPHSGPRTRDQLWGFFAAQEFTLISPEFHDEFLYEYQLPIMRTFGLTHYGCCEDLTRKVDMLKQAENLRSIAVAPLADLKRCVEQIGQDYIISWRPNPTDMVCYGFDEDRIRRIIGDGIRASAGCHVTIQLKDIETVQGEPERLAHWVNIVRDEIDHA